MPPLSKDDELTKFAKSLVKDEAVEVKETDEIVEDSLEETQILEDLEQLSKSEEKILEEMERKKANSEDRCTITNEDLYRKFLTIEDLALLNNKDILKVNKQDYKFSKAILEETHYIKKNQGQHNRITYLAMLFSGILIGMVDEKWMPFANILWELAKGAK